MMLPAITFCSYYNTQDMFMQCDYGPEHKACKINNLTLYDKLGHQFNCIQINQGKNKTELDKAKGEGWKYGYSVAFYTPPDSSIIFAVNDNSDQVVEDEIRERVYPGQETQIVLSKTVQNALGPPYSTCNETQEFRQVTCVEDCFKKAMNEVLQGVESGVVGLINVGMHTGRTDLQLSPIATYNVYLNAIRSAFQSTG